MVNKNLFPIILIVLDICAAAIYGLHKDFVRVAYWLGAGLLTLCSILMH